MSLLLSGAMKWSLCALSLFLVTNTCLSQVVPATPKNFKKRAIGDAIDSGSVNVTPPPSSPALIRTVTYYSLSESRQWTSSDGKALVGKLIAFEEHVVETVKGTPAAPAPSALSAPPTVVRESKVRLLINGKPFEVGMDRLSKDDREFIQTIVQATAKPKA